MEEITDYTIPVENLPVEPYSELESVLGLDDNEDIKRFDLRSELDDINEKIDTEVENINDRIDTEVKTINDRIDAEITNINESIQEINDNAVFYDSNRDIRPENNVILKNDNALLGADLEGEEHNLIKLNRWNVVDAGTGAHDFNINTLDSRPTVQYKGETGEQTHPIAYLSDVTDLEESVNTELDNLNKKISDETDRAIDAETKLQNNINTLETDYNGFKESTNSALVDIALDINKLDSRVTINETNIQNNTTEIDDLRNELNEQGHFRGSYDQSADINDIPNPSQGDYAYSLESLTIWTYDVDTSTWIDSGISLPSGVYSFSDSIPLMDGNSSAGTSTQMSRSDHRHPRDTTKADASDLANYLPLAGNTQTTRMTGNIWLSSGNNINLSDSGNSFLRLDDSTVNLNSGGTGGIDLTTTNGLLKYNGSEIISTSNIVKLFSDATFENISILANGNITSQATGNVSLTSANAFTLTGANINLNTSETAYYNGEEIATKADIDNLKIEVDGELLNYVDLTSIQTVGGTKTFSGSIYSDSAVFSGGKKGVFDGTSGCALSSNGSLQLQAPSPTVNFILLDSNTVSARFYCTDTGLINTEASLIPASNKQYSLGTTDLQWNNIYASDVLINGVSAATIDDIPSASNFVTTNTEQTITGKKWFNMSFENSPTVTGNATWKVNPMSQGQWARGMSFSNNDSPTLGMLGLYSSATTPIYMYFNVGDGITYAEFNDTTNVRIFANGRLSTYGPLTTNHKTSSSDGIVGFHASNLGNIALQGATSPTINFHIGTNTAPSAYINCTQNNRLNTNSNIYPTVNNSLNLGNSSSRWSNIYTTLLNTSGAATIAGSTYVGGNVYTGEKNNTGDGQIGSILTNNGNLFLQSAIEPTIYFYSGTNTSSSAKLLYSSTANNLVVDSTFRPISGNTYSLGTVGQRWANVYSNSLDIVGNISIDGITLTTNDVMINKRSTNDGLNGILLSSTGNMYLQAVANPAIDFYIGRNTTVSGRLQYNNVLDCFAFSKSISPSTSNAYDLGTSSSNWRNLYLSGSINMPYRPEVGPPIENYITSNAYGFNFNASLVPNYNNNYDLGHNSYKWRNLYLSGLAEIGVMDLTEPIPQSTTLENTQAVTIGWVNTRLQTVINALNEALGTSLKL